MNGIAILLYIDSSIHRHADTFKAGESLQEKITGTVTTAYRHTPDGSAARHSRYACAMRRQVELGDFLLPIQSAIPPPSFCFIYSHQCSAGSGLLFHLSVPWAHIQLPIMISCLYRQGADWGRWGQEGAGTSATCRVSHRRRFVDNVVFNTSMPKIEV